MGKQLPSGTVTFLFTDVEGSTRLLHALGADRYAEALATHRRLVRAAATAHGGVEVDTQGDAFFIAFPTAPGALAAAAEATTALAAGPIRIRIGLHTGTPLLTDEGYVGPDVHKGARIAAAGHGGQVLVSAATAALLDGAELRDLGSHRLKDLAAPERILQLGPDEHPPLKTLHHTNLPVPATPFLGREAELVAVGELIARDDVRLVTLTGPGGTGKTRLALQAVAEAAEAFPGGVWWVPLAALRDPALVVESTAKALGATGDLAEHIGDRRLALLLDNFEHLVAAAAELAPLLAACPNIKLVVTSREPLHLAGEWEYAVDPLSRSDAVELFLTRAVAAKRDFSPNGEVAAICERLDHLPLAIELAAARVKVLSPAALLARLEQRLPLLAGGQRDAPERQRTLRATMEWSHELLTPDEQRRFAGLAVFRGGCTLEAAEAVGDADLDTLQSLVDKSLVRVRDTGRFWMLETIREFALERLEASGEADSLRQRHAEFFLALAEEAEPHLRGDPKEWLDRLDAEMDNLRAAAAFASASANHELSLRLGAALWRFWSMRAHEPEGHRQLTAALAADARPTRFRAHALSGAAALSVGIGDRGAAKVQADEALALHRKLGDRWGAAYATFLLALVASFDDDWRRAIGGFEESLATFEALRDEHHTLLVGRNLAWGYYEVGEADRGEALHRENLRRARASGNRRIESTTLQGLAYRTVDAGRPDEAVSLAVEAYRIDRELDDTPAIGLDLLTLARALLARDRPVASAMLLGRVQSLADETGSAIETTEFIERQAAEVRAQLGDSFDAACARGYEMSSDEVVEMAMAEAADEPQSTGRDADPAP